ncbi:hypothetical protein ABID21_000461 [Pseudorhizobium tarimense]|uniref:Uncharacterized protein n=1 Tax=Pseudorhizobium tarimense TaxID=1079109 RepID=A0ABV2H1G1_9HYPH
MSSDLRLDRNLVSVSDFGYRENILSALSSEVAPAKLAMRCRMMRLQPQMLFQPPPFFVGLRDASSLGSGVAGTTNCQI